MLCKTEYDLLVQCFIKRKHREGEKGLGKKKRSNIDAKLGQSQKVISVQCLREGSELIRVSNVDQLYYIWYGQL